MTLDRDQIKRDAELILGDATLARVKRVAHHCLALLTELEQAEQLTGPRAKPAALVTERELNELIKAKEAAEARLAKVPPLVEALERIAQIDSVQSEGLIVRGPSGRLALETLAAWETE